MTENILTNLAGRVIYFVGIKGTGMAALAELLRSRGAIVTGSDVAERFYTDDILEELGIPVVEGFASSNLPESAELLIHSAAYRAEENPEIIEAVNRGLPVLDYTDALGMVSRMSRSSGVAGVHGKTTTTAIIGTLLKNSGLPVSVLTGSAAANFNGHSTLVLGNDFFVAETCEYRRHFLKYSPENLIITSIQEDHLDYYRDLEDIMDAFRSFAGKLPENGRLIYCADDSGAARAAAELSAARPDIRMIPYGFSAEGRFRITEMGQQDGQLDFTLAAFPGQVFCLKVPGRHNVLNAAAALAMAEAVLSDGGTASDPGKLAQALAEFRGTKRRSEVVGEAAGVLVLDDYGHHPEAIRTTIDGIKNFYPGRRLVVDFMSHTYSRTEALLDGFAGAFDSADKIILHKIYASAREKAGAINGMTLFERVSEGHPDAVYFEEVMDASGYCLDELKSGDIFLTMGAGDNWRLGRKILEQLEERGAGL